MKINNLTYDIVEVDEFEQDKNLIGLTDYKNQKIFLLKSLSNEQKLLTLKHELTHAFLWAYGFGPIVHKLSNETVCDFVAIYSKEINNLAEKYMEKNND